MTMSSQAAMAMINRAAQYASDIGVPVCLAIVDSGAHLIAFLRMDGAILGAVDVAQRKARTAALFPMGTAEFGRLVAGEQLIGIESSNGGLAAFPGGLPIAEEGMALGAIGVSGGSAEQDLEIARHALGL